MRKYSKFVILVGILAFVLMFFLAFPGYSSTNNLPAAVGGTVMVNSNGLVSAPSGFYASNGLALDNPPVLIFDETFEGWGTADGMTWTNGTGWTSTAEVTNGICNLETHNLLSPWITGRGISGISVTWSNLVELAGVVEYTTNDADWVQLDTLSDIRISSDGYRLRVSVVESVPGIGDSIALLDRLTVWGHQFPTRIGGINDYAGIAIRVDNPVGNRDAVNLQTLNSRLAAYIAGGESAVGWSRYPASNIVDLAGNTLQLDPRYSISVVGDTISFTCGGSTMFDITGSSNYTPRIVSFRVSGSNLMAGVVGRIGWRLYPQWTADLITPNWITLGTNQFSSTYPFVTNGILSLSWNTGTNSTEYWRIIADDETGGTNGNGMAQFYVPVNIPALFVNGHEVSPYSATWASNADYSVSSGTSEFSAVSGYAAAAGTSVISSNSLTAGFATAAGNASTAAYAADGAHAQRSDSSGIAGYSTNAGNSASAGYATNAGYAEVAGYAANSASSIPAGTIIQFGGTNPPTGFLLCDGSAVSTNTYQVLFNAIGRQWGGSGTNFNVPDLRGQFLRGWAGTSTNSIDPDVYSRTALYSGGATSNKVGSYQSSANLAHTHSYDNSSSQSSSSSGSGGNFQMGAFSSGTSSSGGLESRPKNAYVMYCIKY
ncbi:MAG: phage tail protein [bacterium]